MAVFRANPLRFSAFVFVGASCLLLFGCQTEGTQPTTISPVNQESSESRDTASSVSRADAIRLAAECVNKAEPDVGIDVKSAMAWYYPCSKAYGGQPVWLVGFPDKSPNDMKEAAGRDDGRQARVFRVVWVAEDGSYSGNVLAELPPRNPPVWLGPEQEAAVISSWCR